MMLLMILVMEFMGLCLLHIYIQPNKPRKAGTDRHVWLKKNKRHNVTMSLLEQNYPSNQHF